MAADSHSKTEKPSPRRLTKARTEGKFPSSREMVAATQFIVFIVIAFAWFPGWLSTMKALLRTSLTESFHADLSVATFPGIATTLLQRAFIPLSVIGGLTVSTGLTLFFIPVLYTVFEERFKRVMNRDEGDQAAPESLEIEPAK